MIDTLDRISHILARDIALSMEYNTPVTADDISRLLRAELSGWHHSRDVDKGDGSCVAHGEGRECCVDSLLSGPGAMTPVTAAVERVRRITDPFVGAVYALLTPVVSEDLEVLRQEVAVGIIRVSRDEAYIA